MARPKNSARVVPVVPSAENVSFSILQASAASGVTPWCVRSAIWDGVLPARRIGKKQIILRSDLEKWIARQPVVPAAASGKTKRTRVAA
jgi:hypothetical protein